MLDVWTASTPLPGQPTLLVIGGGELRDGDSKDWATKLTSGAVSTIVIDQKIGGHEHDWRIPSVKKALCELAQSDSVFAIIWALGLVLRWMECASLHSAGTACAV